MRHSRTAGRPHNRYHLPRLPAGKMQPGPGGTPRPCSPQVLSPRAAGEGVWGGGTRAAFGVRPRKPAAGAGAGPGGTPVMWLLPVLVVGGAVLLSIPTGLYLARVLDD